MILLLMPTDTAHKILNIPLVGFVARSGTGKTSLITKIIPMLREKHIRVAVIKHSHHDFDIDIPGKDSYEIRKAGAIQTIIASPHRIASILELKNPAMEPDLEECISQVHNRDIDLILVEGFKYASFPKIEIHRESVCNEYFYSTDDSIIALVTDVAHDPECPLPILDLNTPSQIMDFIINKFKLQNSNE